jgi:hypothetical protein
MCALTISHIGARTYLNQHIFGGVNTFTLAILHPNRSRGRSFLECIINKSELFESCNFV